MTARGRQAGVGLALALLLSNGAFADDEEDHDRVHRLVQSGAIVPLEGILERLRAAQQGRMLEAELEEDGGRYVYEIEWIDDAGEVSEHEFDAATGEPLVDGSRHDATAPER